MPYSAVTQPLPVPLRKPGTPLFQARGDEHMGIPEFDQAGTLGMFGHPGFKGHAAHLVGARLLGRMVSSLEVMGVWAAT